MHSTTTRTSNTRKTPRVATAAHLDPHGSIQQTATQLEACGYDHRPNSVRLVHEAMRDGVLAVCSAGLRVAGRRIILHVRPGPELGLQLYWDHRGQMSCPLHAPKPGSPQWRDGGWRTMPAHLQRAWVELGGDSPRCHACSYPQACSTEGSR